MKIILSQNNVNIHTFSLPVKIATKLLQSKISKNTKLKNRTADFSDFSQILNYAHELKQYKGLEIFSATSNDGRGIKIIV